MNLWQVIFLSILQGLTEFLPISSSGHLAIFQKIFNLGSPITFDIFVHVGTLLAIIIFLRKEILKVIKGLFLKKESSWRIFWLVFLGSLPAGFFGFFLEKHIERIFSNLSLVALSFFVTGFLLILTKFLSVKKEKNFSSLAWLDSLIIGFAQALAILPGVSRSGSTIAVGLLRKVKQETAFQYSFFLAIPAILGALLLRLPDIAKDHFNLLGFSLLGLVLAGFSGFFSLKILKKVLLNSRLWLFSFYCFFLAILIFIFL